MASAHARTANGRSALLVAILAVTSLSTSCGTSTMVQTEQPSPAATSSTPVESFNLEPADAPLDELPGWVLVDQWSWEPISFARSDCAKFNDVLALEDWGVITTFWLNDGTELFHFTAELDNADDVAAYVDAFTSVATSCPDVSLSNSGESGLTLSPFEAAGFDGFTLTSDATVAATWAYEPTTTSSAVIMHRNNTVSILQVVPAKEFDLATFDSIVNRAFDRLAGAESPTAPSQ